MAKPKVMIVCVVQDKAGAERILVMETDNTPHSAPYDRSGYYNMTFAYWLRNEYPIWAETAHIHLHPELNDSIKLA